ncbi:methionine--tRNA ligase [Candidatus Dojkabacteria bacterium]|nr:methionine--tRNA ligase [Candidatus Dojkabacteria bacterium]
MQVLVAVAWPYVNGDIHVGHLAGYLLPADIFARFKRLHGHEVLMVSGSDCHGTPITVQADKEGISPREVVEKYHKLDLELFRLYDLSYNIYTKTNTENHRRVVQELFLDLLKNNYIVKDTMKQYYSMEDGKFLPDRYVEGTCPHCSAKEQRSDQCEACGRWLSDGELINPISKLTKSKVELKDTEHYFLDFKKFEKKLSSYLESRKKIWKKWVLAEAEGWLREGLEKRAITRDLDWGIELPIEEIEKLPKEKHLSNFKGKRIYVWFEAVIGYLSGAIEWSLRVNGQLSGGEQDIIFNFDKGQKKGWKEYWLNKTAKHYYFMGQDNLVFHTLMWPVQLMGTGKGYNLPTDVVVNKFMNYENKKFSKSRGWTIDSARIAKRYGVDLVRYYIIANLPENKEGNFTWKGFTDAVNNELVANLGNFVHRSLSFIQSRFNAKVPEGKLENEVKFEIRAAFCDCEELFEKVKLVEALERLFRLVAFANRYFDKKAVWKVVKEDEKEAENILYNCVQIIAALRVLLSPFLPGTSEKISAMLGQANVVCKVEEDNWRMEEVKAGTSLGKIDVLFEKLDFELVEREREKMK